MSFKDLQSELIQAQNQALAPSTNETSYDRALEEHLNDRFNRIVDPTYDRRRNVLDAETYDLRNKLNQESNGEIQLRAEAKVKDLVDRRVSGSNELFQLFTSDPDLQVAYPTNGDKITAIADIQNQISEAANPYNALKGYQVEGEGGFFSDLVSGALEGLGGTASELYYAPKRGLVTNALNNLPLNQLDSIKQKFNTRDEIQSRIKEARSKLFSPDMTERTKALKDLQYYQGTIDGLALTPEEQRIWDTYGAEYDRLKAEELQIDEDKADLLGTNKISASEAEVLMRQYGRKELHKNLGIDPSFGEKVWDYMKDSVSSAGAAGKSLGNILSTVIPFMIHPALGVASAGSLWMEYSSKLLQDHLHEFGEIDNTEILKAALYGGLAAGIDYYGSKGFTKGYNGIAGQFFRGLGKTDAERIAAQGAKELQKKWSTTLRGLTDDAKSTVIAKDIQNFLLQDAKRLSEQEVLDVTQSLKGMLDKEIYKETLGSKAKKAIASLPEGIVRKAVETPVKMVEGVGKAIKGVKTGNAYLHKTFDASIGDMAKAGIGLAGENVGSSLVRQAYTGKYDEDELAQGIADGFVSGGLFHGASGVVGKGYSKVSPAVKSIMNKFTYGGIDLDSKTNFNTFIDKIKNADKDSNFISNFDALTNPYLEQLEAVQERVDKAKVENQGILDTYGKFGLEVNEKGEVTINEQTLGNALANSAVTRKDIKEARNKYLNNKKLIDKAGTEVESRIAEFKAAVKEGSRKILNTTRESTEYTEEEKESVKQSYVNTLNENEQVNFLREEEGMDEQTAKAYLEAKKNKSELSEEYTTKVDGTDVSISDVFKRGNTEVLKYADILKNPEVRKAIANTDKEAFDKAINNLVASKEISQARADKVKSQLNADKFAQYTRYETKGSKDGVFKSLNKAVQKDVIDSLGLKDKVSEEEAKADNNKLTEYVKQYLTNAEDGTILQKARDIKKNLNLNTEQSEIVDKAVNKVRNAIDEAIKQNKQLIGKKVYKTREEAEKALKDTKLSIGYKVNEVTKDKYTLVEKDTKALQDMYDTLKSKEEGITKQDIDSFVDEYLKDLDIDESSGFKIKDKILKTFQQYHSAPKDNKSTVRESLLGELDKLIKGRKATLAKVADIVSNQSKIRSAIHGYSAGSKDYIGDAETSKKEKALKRQQAKEKQEQLNTNKRYTHLTDIQAKMLTVYSLNALYARFTNAIGNADINNPDTWANVNIFTQADLRNLNALLQRVMKIPNSEARQQYIQTMLSVIQHTNIQQNTINTVIDEDYVNSGDTSHSNDAITDAITNNGALRDAFHNAFPQEEISQTPMSIPEVLLADNVNEAANNFDTQEKARALHQFSHMVNTHWARSLDILNALRNAIVDGNSILETITKDKETLPANLHDLRNSPAKLTNIMRLVFNSKEALDFLGLNPTSIGVTMGSNKSGAGISSFTDLHTRAPNKQFNFTQNANEGNTTAITAYNTSTNLADRLTALDRVFGGTGAIIYTLGDTSSAYAYGAIYKELLDTLEINTRANAGFYNLEDAVIRNILTALNNGNPIEGLLTNDANTAITEDALMSFINRAYEQGSITVEGAEDALDAYANNRASFIKQMLLYVTAQRLRDLQPNHTQSNRTNEAYNNTYKQYQIIKSLPDYSPENFNEAKPINENTVNDLNRLLQVVAPTATLLRHAVHYMQSEQRRGQSSLNVGLSENQLNEIVDVLYTAQGYLKYSSKLPDNLSHEADIAKILQAVANERYVTNRGCDANTVGNNNLRCRTRNTIRDAVEYSAYSDQVTVVGNRCILCGENTTASSIRATNNYAGNAQLDTVFNHITELSKQGSRFLDSNLIIDKIFGVSINGNTVYNQEVLNVLSATGLNNLMQIDKGQSDEFLQSLVTANVITPSAKTSMLLEHFSDYQSTCMSLGRQALHSLGLRIASEDSRANIEEQLAAELGARALQLLEAAGYVEKSYVTAEGEFVSTQPTQGKYIRAIRITSKGSTVNAEVTNASNYTFTDTNNLQHTGHVLEELLNGVNEKLPLTTEQLQERQTQLEQQFNADQLIHRVEQHTANITSLNADGTEETTEYTVEVIPFTGLTRVHGDIRGQVVDIYLPRSATYKANGVMNSPEALVELAYKSTEERTFDKEAYEELLGRALRESNSVSDLIANHPNVAEALGMDLDPLDGYYETYRIQKNEQIFRRAKEFDRYAQTLNGTERLTFPVVMTPNNRFLVDSPIFDYREFKPVRDLFHIVNSNVGTVSLRNPDGTLNETRQTMAMATILFNMGIDVDKMTFPEIRKVFEEVSSVLREFRASHKEITRETLNKALESFKYTVYKGKEGSKTFKIDNSLPAQLLIRDLNRNSFLLENISLGNPLIDYHYLIEVDGLNNGSAHHFAQSGIFSNTDSVSIAKAIAVGMVPNSIREETTFGDFISLMVDNPTRFRDVYMQSAETAKEYTVAKFITKVVTDVNESETKLQLLKTLADIFGLDQNLSVEDKITGLMSRDVMKKVAMPSTYGAGFDALLSHLSENITKEIAKRRFRGTKLTNIYDALARYNGGELVLLDKVGKKVLYSKVRSALSLEDYLPFIEGNDRLFNLIKDTCLNNTVRGAKSVTEEATERGAVLSNAVEAQCQIFTAMVQKLLKENYAGRDLGSITYREQEAILNSLNTHFNFGTQNQTLDTLRPAVLAAIKLVDYNNKVTAHYRGGDSSVRFGSDIAKESLGSAFSPIYIHGFDASNIAEAQQIVRNTLGAFTGVHDAVMINLRQFTGDGTAMSVPKAMNKSFIDNALTAYAPLLEMSTHLQQGLDKLSDVLSEDTIRNIQNSMRDLNNYATLELSNIYNLLQEAIKNNGLTINQFPFGEATGFRMDAQYAQEQLNRITERLSENQMKNIYSLSAEGFVKWLESNNKEAFKAFNNNREKLNTLVNINSLMSAIRERSQPFGNIDLNTQYGGHSVQNLIDEYVKYMQGQYGNSFFKTFNDAMLEQAEERTNRLPRDLNQSTAGKNAHETLVKVIDLLSTAEDLNISDNKHLAERSSIIKQINQKAYKLLGLRMDNSDTYDALAMVVELTTKYNIPTQDLVRLKELLDRSGYLNSNLNLSGFNKYANSILINATEVNLSDTLNHISSQAMQAYSTDRRSADERETVQQHEENAFTAYLKSYMDKLEDRITKTGATQIILRMDSAIDYMLLPAINQRIQGSDKGDLWYGRTIAIVPNISDVSSGSINKTKTHLYALEEAIGRDKLHSYTVLNSTENKDLDLLNYAYHGQFTQATSMTGQSFDNSAHAVYLNKDNNTEVKKSPIDLDRDNPDIYIANYYGEIQSHNPRGICTPVMLQTQKSANDVEGISEYETNVAEYTYGELPETPADMITTDGTPNLIDITASIPEFTAGSHFIVGLNSDGTVMNSKVYNSVVSRIPALTEAYEQAKDAYVRMEKKYAADPDMNMDIIHQPITIKTHLNNLTPIKVTFVIGRDNRIPVNAVLPFIRATQGSDRYSARYVLQHEGDLDKHNLAGRRALAQLRSKLRIPNDAARDSNSPFSKWLADIYNEYSNASPEKVEQGMVTIPENILNLNNTTYDSDSILRDLNINKMCEISNESNVIFLSTDANPYFYRSTTSNPPTLLAFNRVRNYESQKTVGNRITSAIATATYNTVQAVVDTWRMHRYSSQKSPEDMSVYDTAVYKDLTCTDSQELFDTLVSDDRARNIDTTHLNSVFSKLKSLNMNIRYYMNKLAYSQGGAFIETINAKPTGYINFNTKGTGSHAEVFIHEYTHIPLEYLKYDPNAYRLATQLYQFSAKNLTLEDFDCSREEANRIFNYIFRDSGTTDPQIEFLTYSLTNADFRKALDNMAKRVKFKEEFDNKTESLLARFVNKISGSLDTSHVSNDLNSMVFDIFKRSIDLCNEYGKKAPRNERAYLAEKMQLSNADLKIQNAITSGLSKVSEALSSIADTSIQRVRTEEALRLAESNQDSRIANQMKDILPAMMDALPSASEGFQDIANQLRQSFEGVSDNNYAYVKLRYQAKETIDKARENSASALNEVIRKATKNISQKTLNEMSEYVLKSDMSCLVSPNGYTKQELGKILSDKKFRKNEIERLEKVLHHNTFGNFYVNASKGLVDKLLYGVNTSGIGYNNAYEIANMSGTATASLDSPMESEIDKYITLSVMDKLDSKNPKVYAELYKNLDTLTELLNIHNGLKGMEYSQVYPNSMQKVHIPKGELHGGKVTNKYTVVPKSQLKAYKWAGYNSLGKVKFDPFYNSLMNEDFYKVEAKHMPNIPYVDGIPVLTDIFNGRNKTGTYLSGKKLETTQISPSFQNQEFQVMSGYLARKVQELNSPNFRPLNPDSIDGVLTPTFGIGNKLSGCDFQLNEKDSDKYLNRHVKFTSALGDHYGSIIERMRAPDWNNQVAQALDDLYQQRHTKNDFTWLKEDTDNKEQLEVYKLLPYEIKQFFKDKYGVDGVPVETRYLTGIVGYREISASKVDLEWNNKLRKSFTDYVSHIFHNGYVAKGENFLRYLTKLGKENIVIKGIAVSMDNILSNNVTLSVLGLSPEKVCKYQIEGLNNLLKYKEMSRERYMLKTKELTNSLTEGDRARIRALEASMHALPISYLAEHGGTPTIAEDVTETDRLAKDFIDTHFKKEFQTIAHNAIGDQKSWVYKHLSDLATFGDITARYAQFKYLTEDKHINQEEAFRQCMQTFIDYSNPLPKSLQYFDSIGALPFTKFLLGNQTNVLNSLVRKPSRALAGIMATSAMGIPSIYDSILGLDSFTKRWKVPGFGLWYDSLGTLPINRAFDIL